MSDGIKWALLAASIITIIAVIFSLPLTNGLNISELVNGLGGIVDIAGSAILTVRNFINNLLTPVGRNILTGVIGYIFFKWIYTQGIKITLTVYHWIFK